MSNLHSYWVVPNLENDHLVCKRMHRLECFNRISLSLSLSFRRKRELIQLANPSEFSREEIMLNHDQGLQSKKWSSG